MAVDFLPAWSGLLPYQYRLRKVDGCVLPPLPAPSLGYAQTSSGFVLANALIDFAVPRPTSVPVAFQMI